jgi:ABC-type antimicrobial peptide transport system permease subunit
MTLRLKEQQENSNISIEEYRVGRDFKETYGIKMKAGRWFDFDSQSDLENFVINETALKTLGVNDVLGKEAIMWNREGKIIGIVNDFHSSSLKNTIRPLIITAYNPVFYTLSIRLNEANKVAALVHIKQTFESFDADYNYSEWYLETHFENLYKQEENNNIILNYASLLAILIAILGLLGLSVYMITSRTHEIAIRKVLGASGINISLGILKEILSWVFIANLLAWPIAWLVMRNWLEGFPYHISLSPYYFITAGIISLIIVIITIGFQTYKVSRSNPVNALKQE